MIDNTTNRSPLPATARADFATRVAEADVLLDGPIFPTCFAAVHIAAYCHTMSTRNAQPISRIATSNMLHASALRIVVAGGTTYAKQSARGEIEKVELGRSLQ
jgi:hypothetical protein